MQRILVVEDEMQIARTLRDYLEVAGFDVTVVGDGSAALASARGDRPDLVVLDLGLPGMDGLDVARELRRTSATPIVMLTARGEESDRIVGLELGADDYLVKPFSPEGAGGQGACGPAAHERHHGRSRSDACRRRGGRPAEDARSRGRARGRPHPHGVPAPGDVRPRTGRVFTRGQLLDALHGVTVDTYERAIDAHVKNLRRKIEPEVGHPRYVLTVHGVGYRFADA